MEWWWWALLVLGLVVSAIYATLWALEDTFLLHPRTCRQYVSFDPDTSERIPLSSGGLLMHCVRPNIPHTLGDGRVVLCLHGNAGDLDGMANLARMLLDRGYDVYLLEYGGYGECARGRVPTMRSLVRDLAAAWNLIPHAQRGGSILFGFSMGGGVICEFLRTAPIPIQELPAQIALLNTYHDLPTLVRQVLPIPGVSQFMRTRWNADAGIQRYCKERAEHGLPGNVLVVAALDDELIPIDHAHKLIASVQDTCTERILVVLPNGGHNNSVETHSLLWLPSLIPSTAADHTNNVNNAKTLIAQATISSPTKLSPS